MRLTTLQLTSFRNHRETAVEFGDAAVCLFVGENGAGKTNVLEAVSLLSLAKSCRSADDEDILGWDASFYRVRAQTIADDGAEGSLEIVTEMTPRRRKAAFVRDVRTSVTEFVGTLPTAVFLPEDLSLFRGPPAERRRFLDQLLCQVSQAYLRSLVAYQRLLRQRNALLKRIAEGRASADELSLWDVPFVQAAAPITLLRSELLHAFSLSFDDELRQLGLPWTEARLRFERVGTATDAPALERELLAELAHHRSRDIALATTTVGPHREDWALDVAGRPSTSFASRGQERIAVLALLFLEVSFLEMKRGEKPVILLDDVFSELDEHRQESLLASLGAYQVLLTSAQPPPVRTDMRVWEVREGAVALAVH